MTDTSDSAGAAATATAYGQGTADASGLWLVIHTHKHGEDHLVIRADHEPTEDEVLALRIIDFEPDRDEELRILSLEADRVLTLGAGQPADQDSVIRIEWPGEPHPDGRLAKLLRINRGGKPVVRMYAYGVGAERVVEAPYAAAGEADVLLAEAIDRVCTEVGDDGPRSRDRRRLA